MPGKVITFLKEKTQWLLEVPFCPIRKLGIRNDCVN